MKLTPVRQTRASHSAVEQLERRIRAGDFAVGDRLPTERELCAMLRLSRPSVREALRSLEATGLVRVEAGRGAFVMNNSPLSALTAAWASWMAENGSRLLDLLDVREVLERRAAHLTAEHVEPDDLRVLSAMVAAMEAAVRSGDIERLTCSDRDFHELLARASRNEFLVELLRGLSSCLQDDRAAVLSLAGRAARSHREHEAIYRAIAAHDPARAERAIRHHYASVRRDVIGTAEGKPGEEHRVAVRDARATGNAVVSGVASDQTRHRLRGSSQTPDSGTGGESQ